jgi:hypothetical protein
MEAMAAEEKEKKQSVSERQSCDSNQPAQCSSKSPCGSCDRHVMMTLRCIAASSTFIWSSMHGAQSQRQDSNRVLGCKGMLYFDPNAA